MSGQAFWRLSFSPKMLNAPKTRMARTDPAMGTAYGPSVKVQPSMILTT